MAQSGTKHQDSRISGQTIIDELIRNMELGCLELAYSILVPCIFNIYLHPDDYKRLHSVEDLIRDDAKRALRTRIDEWNAKARPTRRNAVRKTYRIAQKDWWIGLFPDIDNAVPPGDVEIHSELNESTQPGYRGVKTTLIARDPAVTSLRGSGRDFTSTRPQPDRVLAEIRYQDDSGPQTFLITQDQISIGRGGDDLWVDIALYAPDEISREHLRLRRDPEDGAFRITDLSRNGTSVNGRRLARNVERPLPEQAEINLADTITLSFEARNA